MLYYATNGNEGGMWKSSTDWLDGHECSWYGVRCEMGDDKVMYGKFCARGCDVAVLLLYFFIILSCLLSSVTYLDLSNNLLDGSIPSEIG